MTDSILLPRILLTNDDGFDAPGLAALAEIAAAFAQEVWVVAPEEDQSGAAQRLSLRTPVSAQKRGERRWSVKGSPSDCVALAIDFFMAEAKPSLVLSGVNATNNFGDEVNLSGTVGAAMTALLMGVPAIAISQGAPSHDNVPWETTRAILPQVLQRILAKGWRKETALNVNIPNLPPEKVIGYRWTSQAQKNVAGVKAYRRISPRGSEYFWIALHEKEPLLHPENEAAAMADGYVALTALSANRAVEIDKPPVSFAEPEKKEPEPEPESDETESLQAIAPDLTPEPEPEGEDLAFEDA